MIPLTLPENYNVVDPQLTSLDYECPWMTPESVDFLVDHLDPEFRVLEIGCGGSTLFFARRCARVMGIELDKGYHDILRNKIQKKQLSDKIDLSHIPADALLDHLDTIGETFDVISIDHAVHHPNRSECFDRVISRWSGKIFVMDNYAKRPAWPKHKGRDPAWFKKTYPVFQNCNFQDFRHPSWAGKGTKIISSRDLKTV